MKHTIGTSAAGVLRLSALAPHERAAFVQRFAECGPALASGSTRLPSVPYAESVVAVALRRSAELLLAVDGDRVTGRALVAESLAEAGACGVGLFCVEADGARTSATALVEAAREWAAGHGHTTLYAPLDVNTWFSYRFGRPAPPGTRESVCYSWEPSQPAEYVALFNALGFDDAERYRSDFVNLDGFSAEDVARHTAPAAANAVAAGFSFERLGDRPLSIVDELHPLCLDAFHGNRLFEPVPLDLFRALIAGATTGRDIANSHWVRDASGRMVGFVLAISEAGTLVIKTLAVSTSARRHGLATALVHLAIDGAAHQGVRTFVMALIHAGNASEAFARQYTLPGATSWAHEYVLLKSLAAPLPEAR